MSLHVAENLIKTSQGPSDVDFHIVMNIAGRQISRFGSVKQGESLVECVASQDENAAFVGAYLDMHKKTGGIYGQALQSYELAIADIDDARYFNDAAYRNKASENKKFVTSILKECEATRKMLNKAKTYDDIQKIDANRNDKVNKTR